MGHSKSQTRNKQKADFFSEPLKTLQILKGCNGIEEAQSEITVVCGIAASSGAMNIEEHASRKAKTKSTIEAVLKLR